MISEHENFQTGPDDRDCYQLSSIQVVEQFGSDAQSGLSSSDAHQRSIRFGLNELTATDQRTRLTILIAQIKSSLVALLFVAMAVSFLLNEISDGVAILAIIVINTLLGYWQDYRAEKSLAELKKFSVPEVTVRRDGDTTTIPAIEIVPGDLVLLEAGYFVPADCRLLQQNDLTIDESALTGESMPVDKTIDAINQDDVPVADQTNMAFMGTMLVHGHGEAIVTATGMSTELGRIATSLQSVAPEPTPLQIRLTRLSRTLAIVAIVVVALVFVAGLIAEQPPRLMLMTALSLAVAVVPEGLPAVATVALAIGARRMFKRNALIRQLPAVETLGSVSVICSDKTGTLTQNKMTATILDVAEHRWNNGEAAVNESAGEDASAFQLLLVAGCLCNDAQLQEATAVSAVPVAVGEPTEKALVEIAARFGLDQHDLQSVFPRIDEIAFDSDRKRMTTLHEVNHSNTSLLDSGSTWLLQKEPIAFYKGSVDSLLAISTALSVNGQTEELNHNWREKIERSQNEMAAQGTRVLGVGFRFAGQNEDVSNLEQNVVFVGLIGLSDPPRPEAKKAVALCRRAGIRPVMITGDHPLTAKSVARNLGISDGGPVVTGQELNDMPRELLQKRVLDTSVFARVAPADKLHIVEALQHNDAVVAMTGDGVNDAPALKQANIGVAMGRTGTDVSKEAANMILLDDNFATIVTAVEQGRIVYDNVRKFVKYTMSSNTGEVLVMTIGVVMGWPLPLLPLQILWVNLVTDGLPGLALAVESAERNTMDRPPYAPDESIFNRRMAGDVVWIGGLIGIISLATAETVGDSQSNVQQWRTIVFTVLTFAQMGNAISCRSSASFFSRSRAERNWWLWAAVSLTCLLQLAVIYVGPLQDIFHTSALSLADLLVCIGASALVFALTECRKVFLHFKAASWGPTHRE